MNLLVVTAFTERDHHLAVKMYQWIEKLGGIKNNDVVLVIDRLLNPLSRNRVLIAARRVAKSVQCISTTIQHEDKWPEGANAAFMAACAYASAKKRSFLWLESDCVPTKKEWLQEIEKEYARCGKKYMGEVMTVSEAGAKTQERGMMGVGVYPSDVDHLNTLDIKKTPFDLHIGKKILDQCHHSKAFQWFGGPGTKREPPKSLSNIRSDTLLFHSDKSGNLIDLLTAKTQEEDRKSTQNISVVITSYARLKRLRSAYKSCIDAGIEDIVITASGYSKDEMQQIRRECVKCTLVENKDDDSNRTWIAGVKAAKKEHVTILHDDDRVLPNYIEQVSKHLNHPFVVWPAKFKDDANSRTDVCSGPFEGTGVLQSKVLLESVNVDGRLSITPVRGAFKKEDLVEWLTEAGSRLPASCYYRQGFLVGNDLWIYLRAATKYNTFFSMDVPVTSLGCDTDSTTVYAIGNGLEKLVAIYDTTRAVFNKPSMKVSQSLPLHVVTIVLDGAPFLVGQLQVFNRLKCDWHWSIVEGTADPTHCTSWCKRIDPRESLDGTSKILECFKHHKRISIHRKLLWDGKIEMVNVPLNDLQRDEIVMQVDADEFWEAWQIDKIHELMCSRSTVSHAMFWCRYFVGPGLVTVDRNCYANNPGHEWRRAWRRSSSQRFLQHEPPIMSGDQSVFINHKETSDLGLVFDHYSYVLRTQLEFKEQYYGYPGAVQCWEKLQAAKHPARLPDYLPWAANGGIARDV